jgi:glycerophosphoryl diester phosphodiesterase
MMPGIIRDRAAVEQRCAFHGLRFGTASPTDLDAFLDCRNEAFVFIEAKHEAAEFRGGQQRALERLCDACERGGVRSILIVGTHAEPPEALIDLAACDVRVYRSRGVWRTPTPPRTVRTLVEQFLEAAVRAKS